VSDDEIGLVQKIEEDSMRRRIYWLMPDLDSARRTMDDLLLARIEHRHIHFVGREDTDMAGLHEANVLQTSDVIRSAQMGLVLGAAVGCLAGVVAALFPVIGEPPQWGMIAVLGIVGGIFGAWASSLIGVSTPSRRLRRFEQDIERGRILLMVDVPMSRVTEIENRLQALHPEARFGGVEPGIPAFP